MSWIKLDQKLEEDGFNKEARKTISEQSQKYGGFTKTFELFSNFIEYGRLVDQKSLILKEIDDFVVEERRLRAIVDQLNNEDRRLNYLLSENQNVLNDLGSVRLAGFDDISLVYLADLCKNYGGVNKVLEAVKKYPSIEEINSAHEEFKQIKKDLGLKKQELAILNYNLSETRIAYEQSAYVRTVVNVIENPRELKIDPREIITLLENVLESCSVQMEKSVSDISQSQDIKNVYWKIKAFQQNLKESTKSL